MQYAGYECKQGNYPITSEDELEIARLVKEKITFVTNKDEKKQPVKPSFPGALFLARNFLRPLD